MSFTFGFLDQEEDSKAPERETVVARKPFQWIENVSGLFLDRQQDEIIFDELEHIRCVDHEKSAFVEPGSNEDTWKKTDLLSGEYEGGMKIWECSLDLVDWLAKNTPEMKTGCKILELGCGYALPSCLLLREGLRKQIDGLEVVLSDYNDFVLKDVTLSNLVINTEGYQDVQSHIRLGAGDWIDMIQICDTKFDYILAAETLYSPAAAKETARVIESLLTVGGVAFIATKRYYFGVGGGSDDFRGALGSHMKVETITEIDTGVSNIREILKVHRAV